jgi:hypothetical protein
MGMTTVSELFPQVSPPQVQVVTDPRKIPVYDLTGNGASVYEGTTTRAANTAEFWSEIDVVGAFATGATDDTYKEVCNLSGSGYLFHVIAPSPTNNTDTVSFRITVDGTVYTISKSRTWSTLSDDRDRVILGMCSAGGTYTTAAEYLKYFGNPQSGVVFRTGTEFLVPPHMIVELNMPRLRFESSLVVETKVTDVYVGGTYGAHCGATYVLD